MFTALGRKIDSIWRQNFLKSLEYCLSDFLAGMTSNLEASYLAGRAAYNQNLSAF